MNIPEPPMVDCGATNLDALRSASPRSRETGGRSARGVAASAMAAVSSFLLEPERGLAEGDLAEPDPLPAAPAGRRPVIAVFGLRRGCGATVVSRALAAELADRDPAGTAAVACELSGSGIPLATKPASRLARGLERAGSPTRALGSLCLVHGDDPVRVVDAVRGVAPLVIDAGAEVLGGVPASVADQCILVTTPALEPSLARVAAECVARVSARPLVVLNRFVAGAEESLDAMPHGLPRSAIRLPDSRMAAQLALSGREARGELGRAVTDLADMCTPGGP